MPLILYAPRKKKVTVLPGTTFVMTGDYGVVEDQGVAITNVNGVVQNKTNVKCGIGSIQFASPKYLTIPAAVFDFGTGEFTVEFWMYSTSFAVGYILVMGNNKASPNSFAIRFGDSGYGNKLQIIAGPDTNPINTTYTKSTLGNAWHHIAVTKDVNSLVRVFIDGKLNVSGTRIATLASGKTLGRISDSYFNGLLDNIRVVKGACLYTANFTPSTEPLM